MQGTRKHSIGKLHSTEGWYVVFACGSERGLCIGDEQFNSNINVDMPLSVNEKTVSLDLVLRNHIQRHVVYDGKDGNDQMQKSRIRVKIARIGQSILDGMKLHEKRKILTLSTFVKNTAPKINHEQRTVSFKLNMAPSDLSRVYCKYTLPWNPTRRKNAGLVVGTIEGRDIEALVAKSSSSCERGCSVAVISAVPVRRKRSKQNDWKLALSLPVFHYNTNDRTVSNNIERP